MSRPPGHPGFGRWKHIDVPIDVSGQLQIPQEVPEGWQRPRQCLIDDDDAISIVHCFDILAKKWNATAPEIALWISLGPTGAEEDEGERLHVFDSHHEIYEYDKMLRCRIQRKFPGIEGGTSLCSVFPADDSPRNGNIAEILGWHSFSRTEVEHFSPSRNRHDSRAKIEYYVNAGSVASSGGWFNPTGRFLSYEEAVAFLSQYVSDEQMAIDAIKQDFSVREFAPGFGCRPLNAFEPPFGRMFPRTSCTGPNADEFCENVGMRLPRKSQCGSGGMSYAPSRKRYSSERVKSSGFGIEGLCDSPHIQTEVTQTIS